METQGITNKRYLEALQQRILIFDGAMGTNLQEQNLKPQHFGGEQTYGCNDYLALTYPQAVERVHRSFLEIGVDVIETNTFRANRLTLSEYQLTDKVYEINFTAAQLARKLADEYSTPSKPRFVAGSIGPTGKLPSSQDADLSNISFEALEQVYCEQAKGLIEGGVDVLLMETSQDILEVKAGILGIKKALREANTWLPVQVQVTLDTTGRMLLGTDIHAALTILEGLPINVVGINCSTGPEHMRIPIQQLAQTTALPISCIPNAGLPLNVDGKAVYPLEPEAFSEELAEFVEKYHINIVGGCCGTTPAHIKALIARLSTNRKVEREILPTPRLASSTVAVPMLQEPKPFLIGERLNAQGSKKFKQLLIAGDLDGIIQLARQQVESGAHALDLCVALTEQPDEAALIEPIVKLMANSVTIPLVIDTTDPAVMQTALQSYPGRLLLNSTNLEGGTSKAESILALAKRYNAAVIALTIDEQGMAKTAERKLEIARRIYDLAVNRYHLRPQDLVFDALTFTLATGEPEYAQSALETLEGIHLIKQHLQGVMTSLGISNISFGLAPMAREVINSIFLYHAVQAGLDMAIVNPAQITPYAEIPEVERLLAEDLIFNRNPNALEKLIEYFDKQKPTSNSRETSHNPLVGLSAQERLHQRILHRIKEGVENDIDEILQMTTPANRPRAAVQLLNQVLLPAMKEVGDKFGAGELILPFVLQSAEVMKKAVSHLETYLEKQEGVTKGTLILATVYGDVHDIGKNLVKTIITNNGFEVIDLGKQVPAEIIITKAMETKATAIGLSALLVSTSKQMPIIVNELHRRGAAIPVLIGGAAINRRFGKRILQTDDGNLYAGGVFYCKDAFEGLEVMEKLSNPTSRENLIKQIRQEAIVENNRSLKNDPAFTPPNIVTRSIQPAQTIPRAPFWGARHVRKMPLEIVFQYLSKKELFRLSWGAKNTHGEEWELLRTEFESRLLHMQQEAQKNGWLKPQGVYGYFPAQAEGNELIIYDPGSVQAGFPEELTRFSFPRQPDGDNLCLADYFYPVESRKIDVAAFQVVTVGQYATDYFNELQSNNQFTQAYFVHGLAVQTAEAAAEYLHRHIRRELRLTENQGKRYSWGYPAIPDVADHEKVFQLLPVQNYLGMVLTTAYQLVPEQSTAAIIIHHPAAKYFNIGESRIEQLTRE